MIAFETFKTSPVQKLDSELEDFKEYKSEDELEDMLS
jgi:hypothetical protein